MAPPSEPFIATVEREIVIQLLVLGAYGYVHVRKTMNEIEFSFFVLQVGAV